jgi:hypothetical protein
MVVHAQQTLLGDVLEIGVRQLTAESLGQGPSQKVAQLGAGAGSDRLVRVAQRCQPIAIDRHAGSFIDAVEVVKAGGAALGWSTKEADQDVRKLFFRNTGKDGGRRASEGQKKTET